MSIATNQTKIADNVYAVKTKKILKHLFDGSDLNVYDQMVINLSAGAPGPKLLEKCSEMFKTATDHRMVKLFPCLKRIAHYFNEFPLFIVA